MTVTEIVGVRYYEFKINDKDLRSNHYDLGFSVSEVEVLPASAKAVSITSDLLSELWIEVKEVVLDFGRGEIRSYAAKTFYCKFVKNEQLFKVLPSSSLEKILLEVLPEYAPPPPPEPPKGPFRTWNQDAFHEYLDDEKDPWR